MKGAWIATLWLAGCACAGPVVRPVEVKEPVAISCAHDLPQEPAWNIAQVSSAASVPEKLKAALEDLELSKGYIGELQAELKACS